MSMAWIAVFLTISFCWICLWAFRIYPGWLRFAGSADSSPVADWRISLIIPARNEDHNIPALLESLRGRGPAGMEIIVVNDSSTDATESCVVSAMKNDARIKLLNCPEPPAGWAGKAWASTQGVARSSGDWILFCDADMVLEADVVSQAVALALQEKLDALSMVPRMENRRLSIASLLGCFALARALLLRPASPSRRGLVQGAFFMIRRSAYDAVGGFERIRASVLEDVDLGHLLQDSGFRVQTVPVHSILCTRMYRNFGEAFEGMSKHLFAVLGFSIARAFAVSLIHFLLVILPAAWFLAGVFRGDMFSGEPLRLYGFLAGLVSLSLMYAVVAAVIRREGLPVISAVIMPVSLFIFWGILCRSISDYWFGAITWKGRRYNAKNIFSKDV